MPNVDELPDLTGAVTARAAAPPYDEVARRVRARRRRTAAGTLLTVAVLAGGLAVWQQVATPTAAPAPVTRPDPVPDPDEPPADASWRSVVNGTDAHPFELAGADDGSVAVVWRALEPGSPTFALVVRDAEGHVSGRRLEEPLTLTPVPGGWVGRYSSRGWLITTHGGWTLLPAPGPARDPRPGDVLVEGGYSSWLYSPSDGSLAALPYLDGGTEDAYVTPSGPLATCEANGGGEVFYGQADKLVKGIPGDTCVIAGRGDHLAIVGLGDDPDGSIPMTGLMTYADSRWRHPDLRDPLDGVSSVLVTPGGSTVVTGASDGRWLWVRPDGRVASPSRPVGSAFVAGDRVYVSAYAFSVGPLAWTDDDGRTWHETTLPGLG